MNKYILIICFSIITLYSNSQEFLVGFVKSETNKPIEGVKVSIIGVGYDMTTTSGEFRIKLPNNIKGGDNVILSAVKYGWEPFKSSDLKIIIPNNVVANPIIIPMREVVIYKNFLTEHTNKNNIELTVSTMITGGKIKFDIVALNLLSKPVVFNKYLINTSSPVTFECMSAGGGGIEVSAEYEARFHVDNPSSHLMAPPLIIKPQNAVRFIMVLTPSYTGACSRDVPFDLSIKFFNSNEKIAETNEYHFNSYELKQSEMNSLEFLRNKIKNDSTDIYSMRRLADALGCCLYDKERIGLWKRIETLNPDDLDACINLAANISEFDCQDCYPDETIYYFEKALEVDSTIVNRIGYNVTGAYEDKVKHLISKKELSEADSLLNKVISIVPNEPSFYYLKSHIYSSRKYFNCEIAINNLKLYVDYEYKYLKNKGWYSENDIYKRVERALEDELKPLIKCNEIKSLMDELKKSKM